MSIFGKPFLTGVGKGSASGAVASFTDGAKGLPLKSLLVNIDPVQDLHGYDNPWPAGGGKNKLPPLTSQTINGVTISVASDGVVTLNGTVTDSNINLYVDCVLPSGTYTISLNNSQATPSGTNNTFTEVLNSQNERVIAASFSVINRFSQFTSDVSKIHYRFQLGLELSNFIIKPQLELGSTVTTYAPYSNICPISGWSAVNVWRMGGNVWDEEWRKGNYSDPDGTFYVPSLRYLCNKNPIPVKPNTTYYSIITTRKFYYDASGNYLGNTTNTSGEFTTPDNCYFMNFRAVDYTADYGNDISINYPATDHDYHPYSGNEYTITFPQIYANIWDEEWENGSINTSTGEILPAVSAIISKNRIQVVPGERYCFVKPSGVQGFGVFYDSSNNPVQYIAQTGDAIAYNLAVTFGTSTDYKFTVPAGATNMLFRIDNITVYSNNVSVNYPSTDTQYHPYNTVYGGTLDVTNGVLTVDRAMVDMGTLSWYRTTSYAHPVFYANLADAAMNGNQICSILKNVGGASGAATFSQIAPDCSFSKCIANAQVFVRYDIYTTTADFTTAMSGVQLVYELATPVTIQLTTTEVTTLLGTNNIWADTGDVDVEYLKQTLMHIGSTIRPPHYGCVWDQEYAQMRRTGLARSITTNTQNFKHSGSVNPNYDNPFDSIYPWSERKLCNISLTLYQALQPGDNIKDCVTYWENDDGFSYNDPDGVWVYTPEFWGTSYWIGSQRYFEVSPVELAGYHHYKEQITARWRGTTESRTIGGTSKTVLLSKPGLPIMNTALSAIHTYAKNGGMTLDSVYTLDASLLLYLVEYANYNAQSAIGNGVSDLYDQTTLHPDAAVTAGTTVQFTGLISAQLADFIVGAIVDFGTTSGGVQTAKTYITAVETASGVTTVTLADAVTITTNTFVSIHGRINYADADIGSMSGYIGTNGKSDAYYRGEALWGNMFFYTLGAYKSDTEHVWLAEEGTEDNYDAINTSVHTDTGIVLASANNYIKKLAWPDSLGTLFACALCTEVGGTSANPVGDYFYTTTGSSRVLVVGGNAGGGPNGGPFCWSWASPASYSYWACAGRPRLKSP